MSCNNFLSINNNIITVKGINTNDVWNITVINANFMLSKYNGRGPSNDISIIPFTNVGYGLYGDIVFSVNNNYCFKDCITNVNGDGSYFNVSPKYVTLHEKDETYNITVSSDCDNFTLSNENMDLISTPNSGTNYFTITSNTNTSFENIKIIVTNNCNGLEEIVYVSQKPSQESTNILTVNPQYINLYGNEKDFKVNIMSICSGNTKYKYDTNVEGLTLIDIGNIISGTVNSNENITKTFKVYNDCEEKNVTVKYNKINEKETFLCITECPNNIVSHEFTINSLNKKYNILSSSNWYISTYDSNKVNCSKSGNNIIISLGDDRTECENEKIILKNKDGNEAIINYSVGPGLDVNDNIIFTFADGSKELNLTANTDYSVSACVIAYKNDNGLKKPIKWVNNSSGSFKSPFNTYSGGTDDNCVNVEFTALPIIITTQSETTKEYTITLQEQETYKTIKINVSVTKQCENNTIWTGLTVTASDMGKCETTSSSIKVTAKGINTNDKCESGETSTTISDYDVIYNPSGANETEISREVLITVVGKGDYINTSGETIVTQEGGPCTPPPTYEEVYEWDRLFVSGTNMDACDEESVLTIIAEGTKTNSDGTDEDVEENISIERCKITYEPSGANETEEEREITIRIEFEGIDEEITVIQAAGPCSCKEKDVWTLITVSSEKEKIEACDEIETLDIITVTAYGKHIGKDCNSTTTSTTLLSSDYTITYTPNDKNQTNSEREISINVVGKGDYSHLSESTTITQYAGPCSGNTDIYEISATSTTIDSPAVEAYINIKSLKNSSPYPTFTFSENCDWVGTPYYQSSSTTGVYVYQFTTEANTIETERNCTVTVSQTGGKSTTFTITQKGKQGSDCYGLYVVCDRTKNRFKYDFTPFTQTDLTLKVTFYNFGAEIGTYTNAFIPEGMGGSGWLTLDFDVSYCDDFSVTQLTENSGGDNYNMLCDGQSTCVFEDSEVDKCSTIGISCYPNQVTSGGTEFVNNGTKTTITVTGGTTNKWSVISTPDGDNTTSNNNSGTIYIGYKFGSYIIQSDECPEKTCTFKILEPDIKGIRLANNQPGTAKIYKTTVSTGKVLLGELKNRGEEQIFNVTFDDHGSLDIEYDAGQWCNDSSCFVYIRVEGDNLTQIGKPTENGVNVEGDMDGARISGYINGSCSGGFTTASGYYTVMINVKYAGPPCYNC